MSADYALLLGRALVEMRIFNAANGWGYENTRTEHYNSFESVELLDNCIVRL